jgi:hypothetical protein
MLSKAKDNLEAKSNTKQLACTFELLAQELGKTEPQDTRWSQAKYQAFVGQHLRSARARPWLQQNH